MTAESIDDLQDEVERLLRKCDGDALGNVIVALKLELGEGVDKRGRIRMLQEYIDGVTEGEQKLTLFREIVPLLPSDIKAKMEILLKLRELPKPPTAEPTEEESAEVEQVNDEPHVAAVKSESSSSADPTEKLVKALGGLTAVSAFRRECRIGGIMDEQKKVNYISLCKEVGDAKRRGFTSFEIVGAVRKAIPAGELRTYLDSFPKISLEEMLTLIRSAYKEKSATELFRELDKVCQRDNEDGPQFLFRALSLRQRILRASEVEGEMRYSQEQVMSVFMHSVRTGLAYEPIRSHMFPFLDERQKHPDSVLITEMNRAQDELNERQS